MRKIIYLVFLMLVLFSCGDRDKVVLIANKRNVVEVSNVTVKFPKGSVSDVCEVVLEIILDIPDSIDNNQIIGTVFHLSAKKELLKDFSMSIKLPRYLRNEETILAYWINGKWQENHCIQRGRDIETYGRRTGYWAVIKNKKPAILFVHGLGGGHETWNPLMKKLKDSLNYQLVGNYNFHIGDNNDCKFELDTGKYDSSITNAIKVFTLDFSSNQDLNFMEQGKQVGICVDSITQNHEIRKVILIGHSMGGLAARAYMQKYGCNKVAGYMSITTPHKGSFLAYINRHYNEMIENREEGAWPVFRNNIILTVYMIINELYSDIDINSKAISYLEPDSPEILELQNWNYPSELPLSIITSDWNPEPLLGIIGMEILNYLVERYREFYTIVTDTVNKSDGIVPYFSQFFKKSVNNGDELNPAYFSLDKFHTETNKDWETVVLAIDSLMYHYRVEYKN